MCQIVHIIRGPLPLLHPTILFDLFPRQDPDFSCCSRLSHNFCTHKIMYSIPHRLCIWAAVKQVQSHIPVWHRMARLSCQYFILDSWLSFGNFDDIARQAWIKKVKMLCIIGFRKHGIEWHYVAYKFRFYPENLWYFHYYTTNSVCCCVRFISN